MQFVSFIVSFTITCAIITFGLNIFLKESISINKIRSSIHNKVTGIKLELINFIISITIAVIIGSVLGYDWIKFGVIFGLLMSVLNFLTEKGDKKSNDV
jgi:hypothetical protein